MLRALLAIFVLLTAVDASADDAGTPTFVLPGPNVDEMIAKMSLEEKVGQLLFLGFGGTVMDETIARFLKDKKPGGVALFSRNVKTVPQTLKLIRDVRRYDPAGIPMYVAVDQEGGRVVRLRQNVTVPPANMAVGATGSVELAREVGRSMGEDLALLGFNMNFAPVLDVNSNPKNPVIGIRSFGEDPELVAKLGVAYTLGLQSAGVSAVAKHFPGHGDTEVDSHHQMPRLEHDKARLFAKELIPFRRALAEGLDGLITAHIAYPKIAEEPDMPATVSSRVLTGILREELGYRGLVITDGLEMEGIVSAYGSGEAAVRAVVAGADMVMVLWFKEKKDEVQRALFDAVKSGRISEARLDQSVRRVLNAKKTRGLFAQKLLPQKDALAALKARSRPVMNDVAQRAITVVKGKDKLPIDLKNVAVMSTEPALLRALKGAKTMRLPKRATRATSRALAHAARAETLVVGVRTSDAAPLIRALQKRYPQKTLIVVSFGSPYMLERFPEVDAYLCAYDFRVSSQQGAARVLLGQVEPTGRLPVSVLSFAPGHGE